MNLLFISILFELYLIFSGREGIRGCKQLREAAVSMAGPFPSSVSFFASTFRILALREKQKACVPKPQVSGRHGAGAADEAVLHVAFLSE